MKEISYEQLLDKLKSGEITYDQLYNLDMEIAQYFAARHYIEHEHDNINMDQLLNVLLFDIEVYNNGREFEKDSGGQIKPTGLISAVTIYSTVEKTYHTFFQVLPKIASLITQDMIPTLTANAKKLLVDERYLDEDENIQIHLFVNNELGMMEKCWQTVHTIDPAILSGFYADGFDLPYVYNRLTFLYGDEQKTARTLSKFGCIKKRKIGGQLIINIGEYPLLDIQYMYKPRDEGGLNYGKKQASYSLDWIAQSELNLKKIAYKDEGMTLDRLYETDPAKYLIYNIADVAITNRLHQKLKHMDLHNLLRRDMRTPMSVSLRGQSGFFGTFYSYELEKTNQKMRYGMVQEVSNSISELEISQIPLPKEKSIKWTIKKIDETTYQKILTRYPGA